MRAIKRVKNTPKEQARLLRILPKEGEKFEELYTGRYHTCINVDPLDTQPAVLA